MATLSAVAIVVGSLVVGGRADPASLRGAATLLDAGWKFHTGDDRSWSDPRLDDNAWETVDLRAQPGSHDVDVGLPDYVSGWSARGHSGYTGYAWYRRPVTVPAGRATWDILGPTAVDDGYELYWNGMLLGGSGRLGLHPRLVGTRPHRFELPVEAAGTRGMLAVRAYMLKRQQPSAEGGGMRSPPFLAPRPIADALHRAHWGRTIAGYIVDAVEPLAMFALAGLAVWCRSRSRHHSFLVFAAVALALMALRRLDNALVAWTDVLDLKAYSALAKYLWMPAVAAWLLAWNRWPGRPWRTFDAGAIAVMVAAIVGTAAHAAGITSVSRIASIILFIIMGARIVRDGTIRLPTLLALGLITIAYFGDELLDPAGVPGIWFPFGIGVSWTQYIYAALIPALAFVFVRSTGKSPTRAANQQVGIGYR